MSKHEGTCWKERGGTKKVTRRVESIWLILTLDGREQMMKFVYNLPCWVVGNNWDRVVVQPCNSSADQQMGPKGFLDEIPQRGAVLIGREVAQKPFSTVLPFFR